MRYFAPKKIYFAFLKFILPPKLFHLNAVVGTLLSNKSNLVTVSLLGKKELSYCYRYSFEKQKVTNYAYSYF